MRMLNCREISERASEFVDGELPLRTRVQMRLHLRLCRFCREYVRQMALVVHTLPRLPGPAPAALRRESLLGIFRAGRPQTGAS